jgi:hypothetical protein
MKIHEWKRNELNRLLMEKWCPACPDEPEELEEEADHPDQTCEQAHYGMTHTEFKESKE